MKKCNICHITKDVVFFSGHKGTKDGLRSSCKECLKKEKKIKRRTKHGVIRTMYQGMKGRSKQRGHSAPSFTFEWLESHTMNNPDFHKLFDIWVLSGYSRMMKPSYDRIDDNIGYTEYNIHLVDWETNCMKEIIKRKRKVLLLNSGGGIIASYSSISEASVDTGCSIDSIGYACKNTTCTSDGFIWRYDNGSITT